MLTMGVVGYGYWGPNLVRNFHEADGARVIAVSDLDENRLAGLQARYPTIDTTTRYQDILKNSKIDAVAIATPVASHYSIALDALKAGKHVLLTKPMTQTSEQSLRLIEEAEKRNLVLMVDHTFLYTGAVRKIKEIVDDDGLGDFLYYDSVRINLGLFQYDVDVIWDLALHDLSILDYISGMSPSAVSATGVSHVAGQPEDIAYLTLFFESNLIGHVHVNWLAPVKVRRTLIGGSQKMIVYDDLEPSEKIKVYDKGLVFGEKESARRELLIGYRSGDMWAPQLDATEALNKEAAHFIDCVTNGARPLTDGRSGLRMVRVLEAASRSMAARGQPVDLKGDGLAT